MKNNLFLSLASFMAVALLGAASNAGAADAETMGKIDMVSVNKMQVVEKDDSYVLEVEITFQNKNPDAVKMRNGSFRAVIETKEKGEDAKLDIGDAVINELEIPGAPNKKSAGAAIKALSIVLGPKDHESTTSKMVRMWNVLGNPAAPMTLVLKGTSEVGTQLPKGWVFEQGKSYELELRFVPTVQRKVLFN